MIGIFFLILFELKDVITLFKIVLEIILVKIKSHFLLDVIV